MSGREIICEQENALLALRELFAACNTITADYRAWFFPASREESLASLTRLVNQITRVLRNPLHKLSETSWPALEAQQHILSTFLSIINEGEEKQKITQMHDEIKSALTTKFPAWDDFIGSLNSLNTPQRAYPFVIGLKTTSEALASPTENFSFKPSLWSRLRSFMESIKGLLFSPKDPDPCQVIIISAPATIEKPIKSSPRYVREFREPGDTHEQHKERLAARQKHK
jgi:hypothetical protein